MWAGLSADSTVALWENQRVGETAESLAALLAGMRAVVRAGSSAVRLVALLAAWMAVKKAALWVGMLGLSVVMTVGRKAVLTVASTGLRSVARKVGSTAVCWVACSAPPMAADLVASWGRH